MQAGNPNTSRQLQCRQANPIEAGNSNAGRQLQCRQHQCRQATPIAAGNSNAGRNLQCMQHQCRQNTPMQADISNTGRQLQCRQATTISRTRRHLLPICLSLIKFCSASKLVHGYSLSTRQIDHTLNLLMEGKFEKVSQMSNSKHPIEVLVKTARVQSFSQERSCKIF